MPGAARSWAIALAIVALVGVAGYLRLSGLSDLDRIYFDETYYVNDARSYLERGVEVERPAHPPLGKWVIAAGIAAAGDDPFGWRVANALAGTLTVALVVVGGRVLTRSWWPALLAGLLVAFDGLSFVGSRIGMLDASLALWVTAGFVLVALDQRSLRASSWVPSAWRWGAGAVLGLAVATKWSGVLALGAAFCVTAGREIASHAREGRDRESAAHRSPAALVARVALPFVVVPALAYVAAYVPWLVNYERTETAEERCEEGHCGTGFDDRLAGLWREHAEVIAFHGRLQVSHSARTPAWRWPVLHKPVLIYLERCRPDATRCPFEPGEERQILALGNPGLWWPALAVVPALGAMWLRRRSWQAGAVLAFVLLQWLPWFVTKPGFSFYLIPVAPFVSLAAALLCWELRGRGGRWLAATLAALTLAGFVFWRPLFTGALLDEDERDRRTLLPSWDWD